LNPVSPLSHHHHPAVEFRVCRICFGCREVAGGAGIDIAVFPRAESLRTLASPKVVAWIPLTAGFDVQRTTYGRCLTPQRPV
ncbi:MAG: hypothetical protein ACK5DM_02745, partial [Planctomyces sp.]